MAVNLKGRSLLTLKDWTPEEVRHSEVPYVRQFVQGEIDGVVPFHVPACPYVEDVRLATGARA